MATRKRTSSRSRLSSAVKAGRSALAQAQRRLPPDLRRQIDRSIKDGQKRFDGAVKDIRTRVDRTALQADLDKALKRLDGLSKQVEKLARGAHARATAARPAARRTTRKVASRASASRKTATQKATSAKRTATPKASSVKRTATRKVAKRKPSTPRPASRRASPRRESAMSARTSEPTIRYIPPSAPAEAAIGPDSESVDTIR